jgi:hypothetical protein
VGEARDQQVARSRLGFALPPHRSLLVSHTRFLRRSLSSPSAQQSPRHTHALLVPSASLRRAPPLPRLPAPACPEASTGAHRLSAHTEPASLYVRQQATDSWLVLCLKGVADPRRQGHCQHAAPAPSCSARQRRLRRVHLHAVLLSRRTSSAHRSRAGGGVQLRLRCLARLAQRARAAPELRRGPGQHGPQGRLAGPEAGEWQLAGCEWRASRRKGARGSRRLDGGRTGEQQTWERPETRRLASPSSGTALCFIAPSWHGKGRHAACLRIVQCERLLEYRASHVAKRMALVGGPCRVGS